ncbi:MAG TPA: glycine betaine ABC transporter substrate-binding protein [Burkholderiales bacterium]|nr:glycine betaine ABC transporter substrate-binding protein [Burkholderiales bacterium]
MRWLLLLLAVLSLPAEAEAIRIGTKRFTESYILGEILVRAAGGGAELRAGLGNTGIVYAALTSGAIDLYPEYTGTIAREILGLAGSPDLAQLNRALAPRGLAAGVPLGFNDGYALAMTEARAAALKVRTIGDLSRHPGLALGLSQEFIGRDDGWRGLKTAYGLPFEPTGLDHGLAYEALAAGRIDVMDIYTTDAKIARYRLRVLRDERGFFPRYDAVLLYRRDAPERFPQAWARLRRLKGRISEQTMIRLNAAAELEGKSFAQAAGLFFSAGDDATRREARAERRLLPTLFGPDFWRLTGEHLLLVFASLAASVAVGVPLGVLASRVRATAQVVLGAVGVVQTIPSLALLAFLIAAMGTIGTAPALVALFLYALLPIVRNTHAGLEGVGPGMRLAALALGLTARDRLWRIELPLAAPAILAGVKTSAVINVGTATLAAFVGAGGYGERIVSGLALNDHVVLLAGAIPAAALALLVQGAFDLLERRTVGIWRAPARAN